MDEKKVKCFGTMMGSHDALRLLAKIEETIDLEKQDKELRENLQRMNHRFEYLVDQSDPVKPKYHKGIYGKKYDRWTCGNCGCEINHDVVQNYCWNCGHAIKWDITRCLTR